MKKVFEAEGVFIEDQSTMYYMPYALEGRKGVDRVVNHAWRDTYLLQRFREAVQGKRVKVIVWDLDDDVKIKREMRRPDFVIRDFDKGKLILPDGQYWTVVSKVVIRLNDGRSIEVVNNDYTKVIIKGENYKSPKVRLVDSDGEVAYLIMESEE